MAKEIYGPSVSKFQGKTFRHKIQHVEPIMVPNYLRSILDKYKKVTLCCNLMHTNGIGFLNTISRHIMFATGSMIKNLNLNNIEHLIKQVHNIYLQCGLKITHIHADSKFKPLHAEMSDIGIEPNCASRKEHVPREIQRNRQGTSPIFPISHALKTNI